ncbi:alpha/beta fold hydrolase [Altericista sp. CCNU0014]|uniref:alpha/beta fold hydrolase n=1 Tax=Altericista sp. CCNU0014 TaxID=3082949 RepID=UPI00384BE600
MKQLLPLNPYPAAYLEQGMGTPIVFLHGFLGDASNWLPIMDRLPEYRCIALDLLGFGESAKPELRYDIWHQVEFVQQFIAALELENFWLVGHSYGGWTAAAYAIACTTGKLGLPHQQRAMPPPRNELAGLGLIAPAGIRDDEFVGRYNHLRPLLWESPWVDWGLRAIAPLSRWLGQRKSFEEIVRARQALLAQPVAKSFLRDRLRPEDAVDTVEADLHCIAVPTLVIAAAKDDTIPLWHCQTYAREIAQVQFRLLPDADHGLLQSHSQDVAQSIAQFLNA